MILSTTNFLSMSFLIGSCFGGLLILSLWVISNKFDYENDWYPIWSDKGLWIDNTISEIPYENCYYEILYSLSRKKYKLKIGGYKPKFHRQYRYSIEKLNELKKLNKL